MDNSRPNAEYLSDSECTFCDQFRDNKNNGIAGRVFGPTFNRILWEDDSFVVIPALGALVEGWLLIVPRDHFISVSTLPMNLRSRFLHLKQIVASILKETYLVEPIFFEHGSYSNELTAGACIVHTHLHAVPANINLIPDLKVQLQTRPVNGIETLWEKPPANAYVFFEHPEEEPTVSDVTIFLSCQYMRHLIANRLGVPSQWNWRSDLQETRVRNAISTLKSKFAKVSSF